MVKRKMMYNYPFFSFPHFRRYSSYQYNPYSYVNSSKGFDKPIRDDFKNNVSNRNSQKNVKHLDEKTYLNFSIPFLKPVGGNEDEPFFELFGIKLYYDDILLICLMFFLYKEDVKDQYLFFSLILLLLS